MTNEIIIALLLAGWLFTVYLWLANRKIRQLKSSGYLLLDSALNHSRGGVYLIDLQGAFTYVNDEACRILGYSRDELLGMQVTDIDPDVSMDAVQAMHQQVLVEGYGVLESRHRRKNGQVLPVEITFTPVVCNNKVQMMCLGRDITEQINQQQQLAIREQEFRALAENSPDSIARYDMDCQFVYINNSLEEMLGIGREQLLGKTPMQVANLPQAEFFQQRVEDVIATNIASEFEYLVEASDGRTVWCLINIFPEYDQGGKMEFVQVLTRDITLLKEVQQTLQQSHKHLRKLSVLRNSAQEAERKQLAWEVHEGIGQCLVALRMNLSLLSRQSNVGMDVCKERTSACGEYICNMFENVEESIQLVRKVTKALRPSVIDLGIVATLEWQVSQIMSKSGISCDLSLPSENIEMNEQGSLSIFRVTEVLIDILADGAGVEEVGMSLSQRGGNVYFEINMLADDSNNIFLYEKFMTGLAWLQQQIDSLGGELNILQLPEHILIIEVIMSLNTDLQTH